MWFQYSLLSALSNGVQLTARRTHGSTARPSELLWWTLLVSLPLVIVILLFSQRPYWSSLDFLIPGLAAAVLNIYAGVLGFNAYKFAEASLVSPLTNLLPIGLIVSSYLMFGSLPSLRAAIAVCLIVCGVYYSCVSRGHNLTQPFKALWRQRGSRAMLGCVIVWSISVNLEKIALRSATPASLLLYTDLISLVLLFLFLSVKASARQSVRVLSRWWRHILVIAIFSTLSIFFQMQAVRLVSNTSYVLAVKRLDVLFVIMLAGLFLGERHLLRRFEGAVVALLGVALLYFIK